MQSWCGVNLEMRVISLSHYNRKSMRSTIETITILEYSAPLEVYVCLVAKVTIAIEGTIIKLSVYSSALN